MSANADNHDVPFVESNIPLKDVMTRHIVTVGLDDSLRRIRDLFEEHKLHHLLVVDRRKLVGVISDRDLLKNLSPFLGNDLSERPQDLATLNRRVHQIMTRHLITAAPDTTVSEAVALILKHGVSCMPVVDASGRPVGIVTWRDMLRGLAA